MQHLILAPHPDDEVIGCFSLLDQVGAECLVAYVDCEDNATRVAEAGDTRRYFSTPEALFRGEMSWPSFVQEAVRTALLNDATIWAPDAQWELHPLHKAVGSFAWAMCRELNVSFGSYTTNMNVPYLRKLDKIAVTSKRTALNHCYPSQRSLWDCDHRYYLFEGMSLWNPGI